MMGRLTFGVLCLAAASAALGQNIRQSSAERPGPRPIAKTEGRKILAAIRTADAGAEPETDCSHLVHDIYGQAGFPYDYSTSRELYIGNANFTRVRAPQAGDLVVWLGHVGIVMDPKQHSFFSFVRSGPDTQFYDSPYWRARGTARFYRYVIEKPERAERTLEATDRSDGRPPETPREIVFSVAGKKPSAEEVQAAFVEMNQDAGESLRTSSLNRSRRSLIVYRELEVSTVQVKGKRGTAVARVDSLAAAPDAPTDPQPRLREQSLEFEKTKRGWVLRPMEGVVYVKREVALQALSARLAELAQDPRATAEQEREQRQIIRFLNLLVADHSGSESAEVN